MDFTTGPVSPSSRRTLKNRLYQRALSMLTFFIALFGRIGLVISKDMWTNTAKSGQRKLAREIARGIVRRPRGRPKGSRSARVVHDRRGAFSHEPGEPESLNPCSTAAVENKKLEASPICCHSENPCFICEVDGSTCLEFVNRLGELVRRGALPGHPLSDRLQSLTQFNLLRAFMCNMASIGLSVLTFKECNRISPFNDDSLDLRQVPPSLRPTTLQRTVVHHPWIDVFPIPAFRDALLSHQQEYDAGKLCNDIIGKCGTDYAGEVGLVVWCEPSEAKGWEVRESFAKNWSWLLESCDDLKTSTNYWRSLRGDPPLFPTGITGQFE